jgi:hypothetical protein
MKDFSIDLASEKIHNGKTREYFKEILVSYHSRNYRATVVMLYSIVICDLIYKLQELKDVYSDEKAGDILKNLEKLRENNPKSPDWENELLIQVNQRTLLLDVATYENVKILQKHRHLCAHPVMDKNYELYQPNRETTRAHLRNTLEEIFLRNPYLSKDIFKEMIVDIAEKKSYFPPRFDNREFEQYLNTKYLDHSPKGTIEYIFKNLWKFSFRLNDEKSRENRDINYNAIYVVYKSNKNELSESINSNRSHYSNIEKGVPCQFLISFISIFPELYELL